MNRETFTKPLNMVSDLYRSPAFAIFAELYGVYKNNKKTVIVIFFFEVWANAWAIVNIDQFFEFMKKLNPFM